MTSNLGNSSCPFLIKADLDPARANSKVATWKVGESGKLVVSRSDVLNPMEEWKVFLVTEDFTEKGVRFSKGDLLQYLRREPGNEVNQSTQFRHLQPLR